MELSSPAACECCSDALAESHMKPRYLLLKNNHLKKKNHQFYSWPPFCFLN